ncbi:MAG: PilZ domain-containing protein, partial [Candidatus Acidiferrales bacterium]
MSDNLEAPKHRFGSRTERREHPRQDVRAIAYVQLGDGNGGIIINISESGMALAAAEPIDHQDLPKIRFQLPQSADFIEVTGEITWQSDSRRRVGIKFMDLPERARTQIRSWISGEISSQKATVGAPGQDADQSSPVCHPLPSPGGPAARMHAPESMAGVAQPIIAASGNRPQWSGSSADPRFAEKQTPAIAGIDQPPRQERRESLVAVPRNGGEPAKAGEKRHYVRRDVAEVIYIELGAENGGLITNVSETGLAVQAAKVVAEDSIERMRFRLRDSDSWIDAAGKIVWRSKERRKQVGIQFVDLPEVARQIVAEWVALEGKRATAKNAENGERPVTAPVPDRQGANVAAVRSGANAAPILSEVTGVHIPTPAASHVPNTGRAGTQALPQFGQHAMPGATQERAPFRWGLFAVMIAIIAGLSFAAGIVFGPHAWRSSISKDTPPIARATPDPPQPTSNSTAVAPKSAAEPASRGSSGAASFENSINMPKPAQAPSPDRTASTLQNSASAGSLPGGQSKPEDLT